MKTIQVHKALFAASSVRIVIKEDADWHTWSRRGGSEEDAKKLFDVLESTLPSSTYDELEKMFIENVEER